jgi:hypothetical protein
MKTIFKIIVPVLVVIFLSGLIAPKPDLAYTNVNGSFTFEEMNFKARGFDMCEAKFIEYKKVHANDTVLYRITSKKFWRFWEYCDYLFDERFQLPYMDWEAVEKRRGKVEAKSGWMDF